MKSLALLSIVFLFAMSCSTSDRAYRCPSSNKSLSCAQQLEKSQAPIFIVSVIKKLKGATNPELVLMSDGTKAVFKKSQLSGGIDQLAVSEVTAYRLSEALGFKRVPKTTYADVETQSGSLQNYYEGPQKVLPQEDKYLRMKIFDFIISNYDRHSGNYLIKEDNKLVYIDHGEAFQPEGEGYLKNLSRREVKKTIGNIDPSVLPKKLFSASRSVILKAAADLSKDRQEELIKRIEFIRRHLPL